MTLPQHIAIIPDGNRRWAKAKGLDATEGHKAGVLKFKEIAEDLKARNIPYLTFWAASAENLLKRSRLEVKYLVSLLSGEFEDGLKTGRYREGGARMKILGRWNEILKNKKLESLVQRVEAETADFRNHNLTILFGYDGQEEMLAAVKALEGRRGEIKSEDIKKSLWTSHLPSVDLVIRTGGEPHWSAGFMMWHTANSQFYFTDIFWPGFGKGELKKALDDYSRRERRFGK